MRLSVNVIFQILALIGQAANALTDFVPAEYKALAAAVVALIQAIVALRAHNVNPDGSPATVAYVKPRKVNPMSLTTMILLLMLLIAIPCMAQEPAYENFAAIGASWNQYAEVDTPGIAGNMLYAKRIGDDDSTYSFNFVDFVSKDKEKFVVAPSVTFGIAEKILTIGKAKVYVTTGVGVLAGGENVGYAWTAGGTVAIPLGKGFQLLPNVRVIKSSLTDFQGIYGILIGWGK